MKTFKRTYLPDSITYNNDIYTFNPDISGAMNSSNTNPETVISILKTTGRKGILVEVLSKNLKGKTDLHGKTYQPSKFIFTNK